MSGTVNAVEPARTSEIVILGRLQVRDGELERPVAGVRLRRLLVRLAADAGGVVPADELAEAVWPEESGRPAGGANALQSLISRIRRVLPDDVVLQQVPGGYQLAVERRQVDVHRLVDLAATGREQLRSGDVDAAVRSLGTALALWRGSPLPDADGAPYASTVIARLTGVRLAAVCDLYDAYAQLGRGPELIAELERVLADEPLQESITGRLMAALAAAGRTADALARYERLRTALAQELGVDPDPQLRQQHLALLRGDGPTRAAATASPAGGALAGGAPAGGSTAGGHTAAPPRWSTVRAPLTSFLGRDAELRRVRALLDGGRLVTVVGPGGAGKTRLSVEVATGWQASTAGAVAVVELAPVTAVADLPQAVLGALGIREATVLDRRPERRARDFRERLWEALQGNRVLLVMDNCEHLLDAAADLVTDLLARCPDLTVLATSREPLGVVGESLCVLSSLQLPGADDDAEQALECAAVELLRERAAAVSADFQVTDANVRDVAEIVRRLDGLPLAIELAAARVRVLPVAEIARRLGDRFRLLSGGNRAALPRHRSLRAVVEWSWDLLTEPERLLAQRLSSFHGGATEAAAVAVCAGGQLPAGQIPELLLALVDKSLLQPVPAPQLRYRMLETIREYGRERLAEQALLAAADTAHARYFADLTQELEPVLRGREQVAAFATLQAEQDNIAAALRHLGATGDLDRAFTMALARVWFWTMTEDHVEVVAWTDFVLALPGAADHRWAVFLRAGRAMALLASGALELDANGDRSAARFGAIVDELEAAPPLPWPALATLGPLLAFFSRDSDRGQRWCEQLLLTQDPWTRATVRMMRASFAENHGDSAAMRVDVDAALADFESIGDRWGLATTLNSRAWLRSLDSDVDGALADYERAQAQLRDMRTTADDLLLVLRLAGLRLRIGDLDGARRDLTTAREPRPGDLQAAIRSLLVDSIEVQWELAAGDVAGALRSCRRLRLDLAGQTGMEWMRGHIVAVVLAATAAVELLAGDLELAWSDVVAAYPLAAATDDLPIVAQLGVSVAALAAEAGRYRESAEMLGAAARLRGGDDFTDPLIARTLQLVRQHWPHGEGAAYSGARSLSVADCIARLDPTPLRTAVGAGAAVAVVGGAGTVTDQARRR